MTSIAMPRLRTTLVSLASVIVTLSAGCSDATSVSASQAALWQASISGDVAALAAAVDQGADVNALDVRTNDNGRRALNYAAEFNHPLVIRWLAGHGADVNLANHRGFTPLHHAAEYGSLDAAVELLAVHANPDAKLPSGSTPLAVARQRGHLALVALLQPVTSP